MARILTGIQSSGKPHLGNILGAILPAIELSRNPGNETFAFIADLHSLISIKDPELRVENTRAIAAAWVALGFDTDRNLFYRQSKIPLVTELTWFLNCFTPYPMLANAHSFKDKADRLSDVNGGLFTYPVLMASDILLYDADIVPVGKDQKQHLEITRDIAQSFNRQYGDTLVIPTEKIDEQIMTIPGVDGEKMSKSRHNIIDIFQEEKGLKKQIMSIQTDSLPLEAPKDPDSCTIFALYSILAEDTQVKEMRDKYLGGNYGYGHAKKELFELVLDKYEQPRKVFAALMADVATLEGLLIEGEKKAFRVAEAVIERVKSKLAF